MAKGNKQSGYSDTDIIKCRAHVGLFAWQARTDYLQSHLTKDQRGNSTLSAEATNEVYKTADALLTAINTPKNQDQCTAQNACSPLVDVPDAYFEHGLAAYGYQLGSYPPVSLKEDSTQCRPIPRQAQ